MNYDKKRKRQSGRQSRNLKHDSIWVDTQGNIGKSVPMKIVGLNEFKAMYPAT